MKKLTLHILILIMMFSLLGSSVYGGDIQINYNKGIDDYALDEFKSIKNIIKNEQQIFDLTEKEIDQLILLDGIQATKEVNGEYINTDTYYFPVTLKGKIYLILTIDFSDEEPVATIGTSFSEEMNRFLDESKSNKYKIIIKGDGLYIKDGKSSSPLELINNTIDLKNVDLESKVISDRFQLDPILPLSESNYLSVPVVLQGSRPWCWAASIASIINYKEDRSLTANNVVNAIGGNSNTSGSIENIFDAWDTYGYTPELYYNFYYSDIKNCIDSDYPIHALLTDTSDPDDATLGHSVVIRGYSYDSGKIYYSIMDPNSSNYLLMSTRNTTKPRYTYGGYTWYYNYTVSYW